MREDLITMMQETFGAYPKLSNDDIKKLLEKRKGEPQKIKGILNMKYGTLSENHLERIRKHVKENQCI